MSKIYRLAGMDIRCADCFDILPTLEENSIDMVATDPPYFLHGFDASWNRHKLARRMKHNGTVQAMPGGMQFKREQGIEFERFCARLAQEIMRVLKPGGFFIAFSQARLYHRLAVATEDAGFELRDMLAWQHEGQAKAFSQAHFVRKMAVPEARKKAILKKLDGRKTPQLKPQLEPMILAQKPRQGTFVNNWLQWQTGLVDTNATIDGGFPGTLMRIAKPKNGRSESGHLTVKPVALMEHLLRLFSVSGQVVLDPFLGSGTTAIAALRTKRKCLGIEIDPDYYRAAVERISVKQTALIGRGQ